MGSYCFASPKHSAVVAAFGERFAKTGLVPANFHRYLLDGEDSRHVGDYDIGPGLSADEAEEQIRHAHEFLDLAERLIGPTSEAGQ